MGLSELGLFLNLAGLFLLAPSSYFEFRKPLLNIAPYPVTLLSGVAYHFADGFVDAVPVAIVSLIIVSALHVLMAYELRKTRRKK